MKFVNTIELLKAFLGIKPELPFEKFKIDKIENGLKLWSLKMVLTQNIGLIK